MAEEQWWIKGDRSGGQTVSAANTMITLPSNFSLPLLRALLQSSGRNVAQIRVSVCWGGRETGKPREGIETERDRQSEESNSSEFT